MLTVRQYEDSDYDVCRNRLWLQLTETHRELYNAPEIGGDDPGLTFDEHLTRVGPERLWVAELDGTVVGLTGLIVGDISTAIEPESEIEPLVVDENARGQGIGSALVDFLKEYVPANGLPELVVGTTGRNKLMLEFLKKQGFDTIGTVNLILQENYSVQNWSYGAEISGVAFKV